ncbi:MAG: hypothetical protein Q8P86_02135 [bacterium]|nr:hypothetical protein [bacterium]
MKIRLKDRKRQKILRISAFLICLSVIIFGLLTFLSHLPYFQVNKIEVRGNTTIDAGALVASTREALSGKHFFLFPKSNIFLYSKVSVKNYILEKHPKVKELAIHTTDLRSFSVVVSERQPKAIWCQGEPDFSEAPLETPCFFTDKDGFVYAPSPELAGTVYLRFYGLIDHEVPISQRYDTKEGFVAVLSFLEEVKNITNLTPIAFWEKEDGERQVFLENGTKVIFSLEQEFSTVLESLSIAFANIQTGGKIPELEYIDLRFENKVFYK